MSQSAPFSTNATAHEIDPHTQPVPHTHHALRASGIFWTCQDMSGSVEVGELVPVIFNKASAPQHHLIRHVIEYENMMVRVILLCGTWDTLSIHTTVVVAKKDVRGMILFVQLFFLSFCCLNKNKRCFPLFLRPLACFLVSYAVFHNVNERYVCIVDHTKLHTLW